MRCAWAKKHEFAVSLSKFSIRQCDLANYKFLRCPTAKFPFILFSYREREKEGDSSGGLNNTRPRRVAGRQDVAMEVQRCCHAWAHGGCVAVTLHAGRRQLTSCGLVVSLPLPGILLWVCILSFFIVENRDSWLGLGVHLKIVLRFFID